MAKEQIYSVDDIRLNILESNPPQLQIIATGTVTTTGWKDAELVPFVYIQPPPDGIYDFDFVAEPPTDIVAPVLTPIEVSYILNPIPDNLKGVRIHAATNSKEAYLSKVC